MAMDCPPYVSKDDSNKAMCTLLEKDQDWPKEFFSRKLLDK